MVMPLPAVVLPMTPAMLVVPEPSIVSMFAPKVTAPPFVEANVNVPSFSHVWLAPRVIATRPPVGLMTPKVTTPEPEFLIPYWPSVILTLTDPEPLPPISVVPLLLKTMPPTVSVVAENWACWLVDPVKVALSLAVVGVPELLVQFDTVDQNPGWVFVAFQVKSVACAETTSSTTAAAHNAPTNRRASEWQMGFMPG